MQRFETDRYYPTTDPALRLIGTKGTMAIWRHEGRGPSYVRLGGKVLYRGADLNEWLDARLVKTDMSASTSLKNRADLQAGERADAVCA